VTNRKKSPGNRTRAQVRDHFDANIQSSVSNKVNAVRNPFLNLAFGKILDTLGSKK
jgi:hypothetical protein